MYDYIHACVGVWVCLLENIFFRPQEWVAAIREIRIIELLKNIDLLRSIQFDDPMIDYSSYSSSYYYFYYYSHINLLFSFFPSIFLKLSLLLVYFYLFFSKYILIPPIFCLFLFIFIFFYF